VSTCLLSRHKLRACILIHLGSSESAKVNLLPLLPSAPLHSQNRKRCLKGKKRAMHMQVTVQNTCIAVQHSDRNERASHRSKPLIQANPNPAPTLCPDSHKKSIKELHKLFTNVHGTAIQMSVLNIPRQRKINARVHTTHMFCDQRKTHQRHACYVQLLCKRERQLEEKGSD
jgi:hypothetical protein